MGWTHGDDEEDSSSSDGEGTDRENNSDDGTENSNVDGDEDDQPALHLLIDPEALWVRIYNDSDLQDILNGLENMNRNEAARRAGDGQAETPDQQEEHLTKALQDKEDQYRPDVKDCIKQQFINTVMERAKITTLSKTLFILKIILEEAPGQITGSYDKTPLLHHIINLEAKGSQEKQKRNNKNPFWGFTSQLFMLVADTHLSEAIVKTNKKGENCLHLIVRHMDNICDASSIISPLAHGSTAFTQKRSEDGNTPLHDALHFSKVAKRIIPCHVNQVSSSGQPTKTKKQRGNKLCQECDCAHQANKKLPSLSAYRGLIGKLVAGCSDVLKQHNHAGQPPYVYHLDTRMQSDEDVKKLPRCSSRNSEADPGGDKAADHSTAGDMPFPHPRPSRQDTGKMEKQLGHQKNVNHPKSQDAQAQEHGYDMRNSFQLVKDLEKHIHAMSWGYADMIRCFFLKRNMHGVRNKPPKIYLNQDFRLPTRVSANTSSNYNFFKFESRLALVSLSLQPDDSYKVEERDEIGENDAANMIEVFRWLREDKGVTKILKLVVKDNPKWYCSEETIERCLGYMKEIRFLNWDRPDLSVTTLTKAKRLIEVSLYSSGINAVLHHWSDENGLVTLSKLKKVSLRAERGSETSQRSERNIEDFQKRLKEQCKRNVDKQRNKRDDKDPTNNEDGDNQQRREIKVEVDKSGKVSLETQPSGKSCSEHQKLLKSAAFEAAQEFSTGLVNYIAGATGSHPIERKIKIALLDDGVNPEYQGLGHFFAGTGHPQSSLEPEAEDGTLFYSSTKGHGNKMAWVISRICPFVEFYVAKIDSQEDRGDLPRLTFDASQAVTALEWALAQDVDIISMSWNFMATESVEVQAAVKKMKELLNNNQSRTLLFCAARDDKGTETADTEFYPADCDSPALYKIGAANAFNQVQSYVWTDRTDFVFQSENVLPHSNGNEGGNSVATAVAAGVAALALYCLLVDNVPLDRLKRNVTRPRLIRNLFGRLQPQKSQGVELMELFKRVDNDAVVTPRLLADRVFVSAGILRSEVVGPMESEPVLGHENHQKPSRTLNRQNSYMNGTKRM